MDASIVYRALGLNPDDPYSAPAIPPWARPDDQTGNAFPYAIPTMPGPTAGFSPQGNEVAPTRTPPFIPPQGEVWDPSIYKPLPPHTSHFHSLTPEEHATVMQQKKFDEDFSRQSAQQAWKNESLPQYIWHALKGGDPWYR